MQINLEFIIATVLILVAFLGWLIRRNLRDEHQLESGAEEPWIGSGKSEDDQRADR